MLADSIQPNEATFTSLARLTANNRNRELAFDHVKQMAEVKIPPKLRSYGPTLFGFCEGGDYENARKVELHMEENGVAPEEDEIRALLKVCVGMGRGEEVYRVLHRMRSLVRRVGEETAEGVERLFKSEAAEGVGKEVWDEREVKGDGGWHGTGWLGTGKWSVGRSEMDGDGVCQRCRERLVCIDIDPEETEVFARKLANLVCEREARADFVRFQVRLTFSKQGPNFHMPPPYPIVIQESERGSWHVPTISGDDIETPRQWVCATRDLDAVSSLSVPQLAQMNLMNL